MRLEFTGTGIGTDSEVALTVAHPTNAHGGGTINILSLDPAGSYHP